MRDREEEFRKRGARVVIVTFEADRFARAYAGETKLSWPLLVDETRRTYRDYGMLAASFLDIWGPRTWWAYAKELKKGAKLRMAHGDLSQRGGDVLIDPAGYVALHHVGAGPADRPPVGSILQRIDTV